MSEQAQWARDSERARTYAALLEGERLVDQRLWELVYAAPQAADAWRWSATVSHRFTFAGTERMGPLGGDTERTWPPAPIVVVDERAFEEQTDGALCGMHAVNNLARAYLLTPRIMMETQTAMRGADVNPEHSRSLYAQTPELFVAALRRGVVLAPVSLASRFQSWPLRFSPRGCFVDIAQRVGGLVLLFPSAGNESGHYQPVVQLGDGWAAFSIRRVTARAPDLPTLLGRLLGWHSREREPLPVVALLPLDDSSSDMTVRLWRRALLANAHVVDKRLASGVAAREVALPEYTPLTINSACAALQRTRDPGALPFNAFTYFAAQHRFEDELNDLCDQLAADLVADGQPRWPTVVLADETAVVRLRQIVAHTMSPTGVGLLFGSAAVLSNANWLRYAAVGLVARRLAPALAERPSDNRLNRLAVLLCLVGWTYHEDAGATSEVVRDRYLVIQSVYREAAMRPSTLLPPLDDYALHAGIERGTQTAQDLFIDVTLTKTTWLLQLAADARLLARSPELPLSPIGEREISAVRRLAFAAPPPLTDASVATESRASTEYAAARRQGETRGLRGDALGDFSDAAKFAARRDDVEAPFRQYYWVADAATQQLLLLFGMSRAYATDADVPEIERTFGLYHHTLEQLYVRLGVGTIYGLVYDRPTKAHARVPLRENGLLLARGDGYVVEPDQPRAEPPFVLGKRVRQ